MNFRMFNEGAYAVLFRDDASGRARKVFRRRPGSEDHVRKVFEAEVDAYEIASGVDELRALVPRFYGRTPGLFEIINFGSPISQELMDDCAYEIEFIDADFVKLGSAPQDEKLRIIQLFRHFGISHVKDASVVIEEGRITKVIDFATNEFAEQWD